MKFLKVLKKTTKVLFIFLLGIISAQVTAPDCECGEPTNVWYKVSTIQQDNGKIIRLDMSRGKAFSDHQFIYIQVKDIDTGDMIYIAFPNGGDWVAEPERDPFLDALDEEFKNLEEYLRSQGSTPIEKQ